jgi:tetratricopeptide (TPR) repeat protein
MAFHTVAIMTNYCIRKSELAVELAYLLCESSPNLSIFWLDATTDGTLAAGLQKIEGLASISTSTSEATTATVIRWLSSPVFARCLLIIDNVDVDSIASSTLENLLRPTRDGHILFITRNRRLAMNYAHPTDVFDMPAMIEEDAQDLLLSYIGFDAGDEESLISLVKGLEYHPLAIKSAGRYIASTGINPTRFLALLEQDASFLPSLLDQTIISQRYRTVRGKGHNSIYTLKSLATYNEEVAAILFLVSCLNYSDLPDELLTGFADTNSRREALDILKAYSILKPIVLTTKWKMPELVRLIARDQLLRNPGRVRFLSAALQFVASLEESQTGAANDIRGYCAHIASVLKALVFCTSEQELSPSTIKLAFQLSSRLCQSLVDQGKPYEAIATSSRFTSWAPISAQRLVSALDKLCSKLGVAYHGSGQFAVAENITREVLRSQIRTIGEDHLETLHNLNNIGVYQQEQARFSLAERCHRKVLEMKSIRCGPCDLEIFFTLNNLALSLQSQKRFEEAEVYFVQALRGRKGRLTEFHPDVLVSMSNLGVLKQLQGRLEQARQLHEATLKGRELVLGPVHPETLKSKGNLALLLQRQGRYGQSADLLRLVCQAYKAELGSSHPDTIKSLRNLASILHQQSKYAEAEVLIREVLDILEEKHSKGHSETFKTLQYLATLLHWQGKLEDALEIMASLYDMQNAMLETEHADTISSRKYLAELEAELAASGQDSFILISCVL